MKTFKKILCLVLALCLVCSFAACGADKKETDKGTETGKEKLVMATNAAFPPYEFVDDNNEYAGIDVEIAELIAEELGMELEVADIDFGAITGGVQTGKYDFGMAGLTVTDERKESVDFTISYANGIQSVIVAEDSKYTSFEDFYTGFDDEGNPNGVKDGIEIGVQQDTTGDIYSSSDPEKWGFGEENVIRYKTGADAVQALKTGKVAAVIIDNEPAKSFVDSNDGLKILEGEYTNEDYAICVSKDNKELLDKINKALQKLIDNGEVQKIIDKYIK